MAMDPKGIAMMIAQKAKPAEMETEDKTRSDEGLQAAAEDFFSAVETKNSESLIEALRNLLEMIE